MVKCPLCERELVSNKALAAHFKHTHSLILSEYKKGKPIFCEYGCGKEVKYKFKNGKWCCADHWKRCPAVKEKLGELIKGSKNPMFGKTHSIEVRKKMSIDRRAENLSPETRRKLSESHKGKQSWNKGLNTISKEHQEKMLKELRNSSDGRKRISEFHKNLWKDSEYRKRQTQARSGKVPWNKGLTGIFSKEALKKIGRSGILHRGKIVSKETRLKQRISAIKRLENRLGHQVKPNFNIEGCKLIDEYGETNGYNFKHAMNGGEHYFKELGYWTDGYDPEKNVIIEIDEPHHFDEEGNLKEKDVRRQKEIEEYYGCTFIRIRI